MLFTAFLAQSINDCLNSYSLLKFLKFNMSFMRVLDSISLFPFHSLPLLRWTTNWVKMIMPITTWK